MYEKKLNLEHTKESHFPTYLRLLVLILKSARYLIRLRKIRLEGVVSDSDLTNTKSFGCLVDSDLTRTSNSFFFLLFLAAVS